MSLRNTLTVIVCITSTFLPAISALTLAPPAVPVALVAPDVPVAVAIPASPPVDITSLMDKVQALTALIHLTTPPIPTANPVVPPITSPVVHVPSVGPLSVPSLRTVASVTPLPSTCATFTTSTHPTCCPSFTPTTPCVVADCIVQSTIHASCGCSTIPTKTVFTACPTACPVAGCATSWQTLYTPCPTSPAA